VGVRELIRFYPFCSWQRTAGKFVPYLAWAFMGVGKDKFSLLDLYMEFDSVLGINSIGLPLPGTIKSS
jgi:hypothetical protein